MKQYIVAGLAAALIAGGADCLSAPGQRRLPVRRTLCQQVRWTRPG